MTNVKKDGIDYINIDITAENKISRKLAIESTFNVVNTLIGKMTSLRTALDYIVTPNYPFKLLTKSKLTAKDIIDIPNDKVWVTNYWAIATHLVFERIYQDKVLLNDLLLCKDDIEFVSFKVSSNTTSGLTSKVINYNKGMFIYINIVNDIFITLKNNFKDNELDTDKLILDIRKLIIRYKSDHEVGLFHNVPFDIEFDDNQLNN